MPLINNKQKFRAIVSASTIYKLSQFDTQIART